MDEGEQDSKTQDQEAKRTNTKTIKALGQGS
jgi:hypothetical protein